MLHLYGVYFRCFVAAALLLIIDTICLLFLPCIEVRLFVSIKHTRLSWNDGTISYISIAYLNHVEGSGTIQQTNTMSRCPFVLLTVYV